MKILYLTFYFKPDLCAGSFRNTPLVDELSALLTNDDHIHVVTTQPNRYQTFQIEAPAHEQRGNVTIDRVAIPPHASGLNDQVRSFSTYYRQTLRLTRNNQYDLVVASSSRLFTAFLGAWLARRQQVPLFLDIRDIFREAILEILKKPMLSLALNPFLWLVERFTFGYARHINLVSEGFRAYFNRYPQATYSFFTNGIDDEFLDTPASDPVRPAGPRTLLYAGNIGEGQGLHKVIPQAARQLGADYRFLVVGDGGAKAKLLDAIAQEQVSNVEVRQPVDRTELRQLYHQADYLFLHLNDFKALEKVLPSKVFEYAATDKPIVAGVGGYAYQFLKKNVGNCLLFTPGDVDSLVEQLRRMPVTHVSRTAFVGQFQRRTIMQQMARQILKTAGSHPQPASVDTLTTVSA
ncbi:glycosyltransferase family 4 protein [Nibrella saemangeumensis]|uniref:Glycosyltransferase family 4 protein n=1 Tax=Nibrella saemangeumensis TaxID=1084526 RepID=A0ABP8N3C2_9BACT